MKNTPTKLLSTVLALLMILSSFVTCFALTASAEEASAVPAANVSTNKAYNLTQGIDFENYANSSTAADYLRNTAGLWITTQNGDAAKGGLNVVERTNEDGTKNKVLNLTSNAYFINGNVQVKNSENKNVDAFNQAKYNKSKEFLDLIYGAEGPKNFTISLDMTLNGKSGEMNMGATSDSSGNSYLYTLYRGVSVLSFYGYKWTFKAISANLPTYTIDSETGYAKVGTMPEDMKDKGYLYAPTQIVTLKADSEAEGKYWYVSSGKTYPTQTGSAIHPDAMKPETRVTYTLGVPFNVRMEFTRVSSTKMNVITFIDNKQLGGVVEYDIGTNTTKNFGFRLFDTAANADIDNIKVEIPEHSAGDFQVEPINTPDAFVAKYFNETDLATPEIGYKMRTALVTAEYAIGSTIANNISDILNGKSLSLTAPAKSNYWIAFDINTPADYAVASADILTVGDKAVISTDESGKLSLLGQTATGNALAAKNSYNVAVKAEPAATEGQYDFYFYVEGLLADTAKGIAVSGNEIVLSANGVNLRNVKAVDKFVNWIPTVSAYNTSVTSVEDYVSAPCASHTPLNGSYRMYEIPATSYNGSNDGVWSYVCSECGIRVYINQTPNIKTTFNTSPAFENKYVEYSLSGARVGASSMEGFNASKDTYIFSYTLDLNNATDAITQVSNKGDGGGTLIDFNDFKSALRLYSIAKKEDGSCPTLEELQAIASTAAAESKKAVGVSYGVKTNAYPKAILIAEKISGKENFPVPYYILELGKQYQITLVGQTGGKTSTEGGIKVYINGELVYDKCQQKITTLSQVRCGDVALYSYYSDLVLAKYSNTVEHTCTERWSDDGKIVVNDTDAKYSYTCYCGKKVEKRITSVVEDNIPYINGERKISYTAPAGEYWMFTDANIPENNTGAAISLGDTDLLNADGLKGNLTVAVRVNGNAYTVYLDGKKTSEGEYTGDSVFTFSAIPSFSYTKLVELGVTDTPVVPNVNGSACNHKETPEARTIFNMGDYTGYKYVCTECGDSAYRSFKSDIVKPTSMSANNSAASSLLYQDAYYTLKSHEGALFTTTLKNIDFPVTWEAGSTNKSLLTWFVTNPDNASTFQQWIRIFGATPSEDGNVRGEVRCYAPGAPGGYRALETPVYFEEGGTYDVAVYLDIHNNCYDLYIDGKFAAHSETGEVDMGLVNGANAYYQIRLGDNGAGKYSATDWRFSVEHTHEHDGAIYGVDFDKHGLNVERKCTVCGVEYIEFVNAAVKNSIKNIADGNETISFTAPSKEYWITTDINIREQSNGNLITLGNDVILTTDDVKITAPNTVQVAICVNGTRFTLYLDGVKYSEGTLPAIPTAVTYGQSGFDAYVRFNNNKIATSDTVTPDNRAKTVEDTAVKNCSHVHTQGTPVDEIYHYSYGLDVVAYICELCGERVYAQLSDSLIKLTTNGDVTVAKQYTKTSDKMYLYSVEDNSFSSNGTPYWIAFDIVGLKSTDVTSADSITDSNARPWKGWGIISVQTDIDINNLANTGGYASELRLIPDGWEAHEATLSADGKTLTKGEGDGYDGIYAYVNGDYRYAEKLIPVVKVGEGTKNHVALNINPATGDYDIYVDGEYVATSTGKSGYENNYNPRVRVFEDDNFSQSQMKLKNFVISREAQLFEGRVTVIEAEAKFAPTADVTEAGTYEALIDMTKVRNSNTRVNTQKSDKVTYNDDGDKVIEFIYVDVVTGQLAYRTADGYVLLYNKEGEPLVLNETEKDIAVIFDFPARTARFFVGGFIPYVKGAEEGTYEMLSAVAMNTLPTGNAVSLNTKSFFTAGDVRAHSVGVNNKYINGLANVKISTVNNKGVPDVLGYQENSITAAIRIISGVDMLYYNSIGYKLVVRNADGVDVTNGENSNLSIHTVSYAVTAEDRDLYADRYGYSYFAALEIVPDEDMDRIPAGYSLEVTPYVTIGEDDAVLNGETVIINVTDTGYEFAN